MRWSGLRVVHGECRFEIVGKWSVEKWFRLPEAVYRVLLELKTASPFVFAAYDEQLRTFYARAGRARPSALVGEQFTPVALGDWFHERVLEWSKTSPKGHATTHIFRKTTLQYARRGEDVNRSVAQDARLSEGVLMANYVRESDEEMRAKSNRIYHRMLVGLPADVLAAYGYERDRSMPLGERLKRAAEAEDWAVLAELTALRKANQTGDSSGPAV